MTTYKIGKTKIFMPCGHYAVQQEDGKTFICDYCNNQPGTPDEPLECKQKRETAEPPKNDYWMNINDYEDFGNNSD